MRLAAEEKAGFYPTPEKTTEYIKEWICYSNRNKEYHIIDPCCGEGTALDQMRKAAWYVNTYGIELDSERALKAYHTLSKTLQGSIYEAKIAPLQCMGMLYLNPPYTTENKERTEMKFLKHSIKWLAPNGVLIFIVPEHIINEKNLSWINRYFKNITIVKIHKEEYPRFKQIVLFATKRTEEDIEPTATTALQEIPHIEDIKPVIYYIPPTQEPTTFQMGVSITEKDIINNRKNVIQQIKTIFEQEEKSISTINPVLPLRKGHMVALLTAGMLNGKIETENGFIVVAGYTNRIQTKTETESKEIVRDSYAVGVRVIERGKWYDIQ